MRSPFAAPSLPKLSGLLSLEQAARRQHRLELAELRATIQEAEQQRVCSRAFGRTLKEKLVFLSCSGNKIEGTGEEEMQKGARGGQDAV